MLQEFRLNTKNYEGTKMLQRSIWELLALHFCFCSRISSNMAITGICFFLFLMQDIQAKHAAEKLKSQLGLMMGNTLPDPSLHLAYRDKPHHIDSSSSSEDEMANSEGEQEDEEPEKDGAVVYNIVD
jgi:hypothetical protein